MGGTSNWVGDISSVELEPPRCSTVPRPTPRAVKTLEGLAHRASFPYALQSYTLDANHLPHSCGPAVLRGVSDLPTRTHAPAPELFEVRVSAALPHVTPMVPYAPSAAHVSRFKSSLVSI